jgi:hypothetical protein
MSVSYLIKGDAPAYRCAFLRKEKVNGDEY